MPLRRFFSAAQFLLASLVCFSLLLSFPKPVSAAVFSCDVVLSPNLTTRETATVFTINVDSASYSGDGIAWVRVTRPSSNFTVTGGTASGWTPTFDANQVTFTASPTSPVSFTVYATTGSSDASSADWTVQMADNIDGNNPRTCGGTLGTAISGSSSISPTPTSTPTPTPDIVAASITNITVSSISDTSATISWTTSESASGILDYGTTTEYGSTQVVSSFNTAQTIKITGLGAGATYHARIRAIDTFNNSSSSGDFTFATAESPGATSAPVTVAITPTPSVTPALDTTAPRVTVTTELNQVFQQAPLFEGTATDAVGLSNVEYSLGNDIWIPVDQRFTPGEKELAFSFTPIGLFDGNYEVSVRAIDLSGNERTSETQTLIIDRLPPQLGGSIVSVGPQVITPEKNGLFYFIKGLQPRITFSAVGGPTVASLSAQAKTFSLQHLNETDLWSSYLSFDKPGEFPLTSYLLDGAGNETTQNLGTLRVVENGKVHSKGQPVANATLTVYYLNGNLFQFLPWDGRAYDQQNPQQTMEDGSYTLLLPPGKYYLSVEASGFRPLRSDIFTIQSTTPLTQNFELTPQVGLPAGSFKIPFFDIFQTQVQINTAAFSNDPTAPSNLIGQEFPAFELPTNIGSFTVNQVKGRPTILTVLSSWAPQASAQIDILEKIDRTNVNVAVVMEHDSQSVVKIFTARGKYTLPLIADPDGQIVKNTSASTLPTHYFLDRHAVVTSIQSGVLSADQIMNSFVD